jgi:hypothetical protein
LSDPDRLRPAVPDPQQDRHVSFPDDAPDEVSSGAPDGVPGVGAAPSGPPLPPEAWAPRPSGHDPSRQEPTGWSAPVSPTLTTPPVRPAARRRRPGWLALLVPLAIVLGHGQTDTSATEDCPSYTGAGPGMSDCGSWDGTGGVGAPADSVPGVWTEDVTATTTFAPMLGGTPKVEPVPVGAGALRVEIVSAPGPAATGLEAQVDTTVGDAQVDGWLGTTPHALEVHLDQHPTALKISATVTSGSGTVQCRVYAGSLLVAVGTSSSVATCEPQM